MRNAETTFHDRKVHDTVRLLFFRFSFAFTFEKPDVRRQFLFCFVKNNNKIRVSTDNNFFKYLRHSVLMFYSWNFNHTEHVYN